MKEDICYCHIECGSSHYVLEEDCPKHGKIKNKEKDEMLEENAFQEIQNKIINAFDKSIDFDDTIYFDEWTTLYEQIMFILSDYAVNANSIYGKQGLKR